jgi:hypothetical protein
MSSECSRALPPRWADSLLLMLLPREDRESVSGDLLEEYRESIVPTLGRAADTWYVRHVAAYVLRVTWAWAAIVGAILLTRYLFDSLVPAQYTPGVIHPRSAMMSYSLMATFALGSGWQAWRSGHVRSGMVVALAAALFGGALSALGTLACLAVWHDPETLRAVQGSGGFAETLWGVPPLLIPIGLTTGSTGAIAARLVKALSPRRERA